MFDPSDDYEENEDYDYGDGDDDFLSILKVWCSQVCFDALLDILDECGDDEDVLYLTGYCAKKEDGQYCYELFDNATDFMLNTQLFCYSHVYELNSTCNCHSELTSMAKELGCCANFYETQFQNITGDPNYTPGDLYVKCNVDTPGECSEKGNFTVSV